MATSSLQDQAVLDQLFQQSMSPINTYSQGLLGLALQRRQEQQQLALQQQRNLLELQLEKQRQAAANQGLMERLKLEHDFKTADEKEKDREAAVKLANQYDANLPLNTDYETAARFVTKARGEVLISLNKRAGDAIRRITQGSGMTGPEYAQRVANEIASNPELKNVLTPKEQENIRANPGQVAQMRASFAKDPKKYEAFKNAEKAALDTVAARITAENSTKPDVVAATGELKMIYGAMETEEKRGAFSPQSWEDARKAFHDAVYPPQPQFEGPPVDPVILARNLLRARGVGSATAGQPGAASQDFPGLIPLAGRAVGAAVVTAADAAKPFVRAGMALGGDVASGLFGGPFPNPLRAFFPEAPASNFIPTIRPWGAFQGQVIPPQLEQFLADEAARKQTNTPTAFPLTQPATSAP